MYTIKNNSNLNLQQMKPFLKSFLPFAQQKMGYDRPVSINFVSDHKNAQKTLGKTAFYDPNSDSISIYTDNRHPKDILRSLSHELVHHAQNSRGDFDKKPQMGEDYFQYDKHMQEMEREAYEKGNMTFRDWEEKHRKQLKESIYYKTGDTKMKLKDWKDKELFNRLNEAYGYGKMEEEEEELDEGHCGRREDEEGLEEAAKPDFLDLDKDGDKKEPMKQAAKSAKGDSKDDDDKEEDKDDKKLDEAQIRRIVREAFGKAFKK
jgi:hypothetical protein